jgi:hypothetical protein
VVDAVEAAHQHRAGDAVALADDVEAVVHAVREVHVRVAGRTEHDRVARRSLAAARMRCGVVGVRFDLDDPPAQHPTADAAAEDAAEQCQRQVLGGTGKEAAGQGHRGGNL